MTSILYAVDPGASGAIARFVDGAPDSVRDSVPHSEAHDLAGMLATSLVEDMGDPRNSVAVVIERVNGLPGQSGPGSFVFGQGYGELIGVCKALAVSYALVPAMTWKPALRLRRLTNMSEKEYKAQSRTLACELWPDHAEWFKLVKHTDRAEACLLGHYHLTQSLLA